MIKKRFLSDYEGLIKHQHIIIKIYRKGFYQSTSILNILNLDILNLIDEYIKKYDPRTADDLYNIYKNAVINNINLPIELSLLNNFFNKNTLLHILSVMSDFSGIKSLIEEYDYEYDQEISFMYCDTTIKITPIFSTLFSLKKDRILDCFKYYHTKYNCLDFVVDTKGKCLLHYAAETGNLDVILYLVNQGLDPNYPDKELNLPVHFAARSGHLDILKYYNSLGYDLKPGFDLDNNEDLNLQTFVSSCLVLLYYGLTSSLLNDNWLMISMGLISCNGNIELLNQNDKLEIEEILEEVKNIEPEKFKKYNECISYVINL